MIRKYDDPLRIIDGAISVDSDDPLGLGELYDEPGFDNGELTADDVINDILNRIDKLIGLEK